MDDVSHTGDKGKRLFACCLLYGASLLGALELYSSANLTGIHSSLSVVDFGAYGFLFVIALLIHLGMNMAKILYTILAAAWYGLLIFVLPWKFDHALDIPAVTTQLIISALGLYLLYTIRPAKTGQA